MRFILFQSIQKNLNAAVAAHYLRLQELNGQKSVGMDSQTALC